MDKIERYLRSLNHEAVLKVARILMEPDPEQRAFNLVALNTMVEEYDRAFPQAY